MSKTFIPSCWKGSDVRDTEDLSSTPRSTANSLCGLGQVTSALQAKFPTCDVSIRIAAWCFFKQEMFLQCRHCRLSHFPQCLSATVLYIALIISDLDCSAFPSQISSHLCYRGSIFCSDGDHCVWHMKKSGCWSSTITVGSCETGAFLPFALQGSAQLLSKGAACKSNSAPVVCLPGQPHGRGVSVPLCGTTPNARAHPCVR